MSQADLNTAQQRRDASAVGRQVGQVVGHDGSRGDRGLQAANEGVAVDRRDDLELRVESDEVRSSSSEVDASDCLIS